MPDIQAIEGHLRDMPKGEKFRKLARMRELRTVMVFSVRGLLGMACAFSGRTSVCAVWSCSSLAPLAPCGVIMGRQHVPSQLVPI